MLTFVDDKARFAVMYPLVTKDCYSVFDRFEAYKAMVENATEKKIKTLRSDNGGEYFGPHTNRLELWGIKHEWTMPRTSQQNGIAERMNRTLAETARSMIHDRDVTQSNRAL